MSYVYIEARDLTLDPEPKRIYRVGFYTPSGEFRTEHRTTNKRAAAARTSWLNGGSYCDLIRLDEEGPQP
jgi:hypothetical protein